MSLRELLGSTAFIAGLPVLQHQTSDDHFSATLDMPPKVLVDLWDNGDSVVAWHTLRVAESAQGKGLGTRVVSDVLLLLKAGGYQRVELTAGSSGAFWVGLGFEIESSAGARQRLVELRSSSAAQTR